MGIVYHASPITTLQHIDPTKNNEGKVFAARDLIMAHAFLGRAGRGLVMTQFRTNNNVPVFKELVTGGFDYRYRAVPGAIYTIDDLHFVPGNWQEEVISYSAVTTIGESIIYEDVRAALLQLERDGKVIIEWSADSSDHAVLNYWLGKLRDPKWNRQYVIDTGRDFFEQMRPHLLEAFNRQV